MKGIFLLCFALAAFSAFGQTDWRESWFFSAYEFNCKCGADASNIMQPELIRRLNVARYLAGVPFRISSGYRTPEHNKSILGASLHSTHLTGEGVDIVAITDADRFIILKSLIDAGFTRIGIYKTHIHVDVSAANTQYIIFLR